MKILLWPNFYRVEKQNLGTLTGGMKLYFWQSAHHPPLDRRYPHSSAEYINHMPDTFQASSTITQPVPAWRLSQSECYSCQQNHFWTIVFLSWFSRKQNNIATVLSSITVSDYYKQNHWATICTKYWFRHFELVGPDNWVSPLLK
jgi:hypothetical protein